MSLAIRGFRRLFSSIEIRADFEVRPDERLVISGPSGSGKSTILRFVSGLDSPGDRNVQGRVLLGERDVSGLAPERRDMGMVFQEPLVFPALSVIDNASFGLKVRGMGADERREAVLPWLERVGLRHRLEADPDTLSGGEKQRLALVRAVAFGPKALLLDEPFSALDPALRLELGALVSELHQKLTVPLVLVTHDPAEAERVGTRTLACQIISEGSPVLHRWSDSPRNH